MNVVDRTREAASLPVARRAQGLVKGLVEMLEGGFLTVDLRGEVQTSSAVACELLQVRDADGLTQSWRDVWSQIEEPLLAAVDARGSAEACDDPVLVAPDVVIDGARDRRLQLEVYELDVHPGEDPTEGLLLVLFVDGDAVEFLERRISAGRRSASAFRRQSLLVHSARNALTGLAIAAANLADVLGDLRSSTPDRDAFVERAREIEEEARAQAQRLVVHQDPLDAPEHSTRAARFGLSAAVDDVLAQFRFRASVEGVRLEPVQVTHRAADVPSLAAFDEVLFNLVENAIDAAGQGGTVRVEVDVADDGAVVVRVLDDGVGLPDVSRRRLFRVGFSTKGEGRGFGLFATRLAVRSLGGRLTLAPREPRGTRAELRFPIDER